MSRYPKLIPIWVSKFYIKVLNLLLVATILPKKAIKKLGKSGNFEENEEPWISVL